MKKLVLLIPLLLLSGCLQQAKTPAPDMRETFEANMAKCSESEASFPIASSLGAFQTSFRITNYPQGCFLSVTVENFTQSDLSRQLSTLLEGNKSFYPDSLAGSNMACNISAETKPTISGLMFWPGYNMNCKGSYQFLMEEIRKEAMARTLFDIDMEKSSCRNGVAEVYIRNTGQLPVDGMFLNIHSVSGRNAELENMPVAIGEMKKVLSYACKDWCTKGERVVVTVGNEANTINFPIKCE